MLGEIIPGRLKFNFQILLIIIVMLIISGSAPASAKLIHARKNNIRAGTILFDKEGKHFARVKAIYEERVLLKAYLVDGEGRVKRFTMFPEWPLIEKQYIDTDVVKAQQVRENTAVLEIFYSRAIIPSIALPAVGGCVSYTSGISPIQITAATTGRNFIFKLAGDKDPVGENAGIDSSQPNKVVERAATMLAADARDRRSSCFCCCFPVVVFAGFMMALILAAVFTVYFIL